ncbi:MAG: thioredoxin family protein [bacterium]
MISYRSADSQATSILLTAKHVLVEFHAKWCGLCRALTRTLQAVEPRIGVPVIQVDIDEAMDLARAYGIQGVPQLLYMENGIVIARTSGSLDESEFTEWFAAATRR